MDISDFGETDHTKIIYVFDTSLYPDGLNGGGRFRIYLIFADYNYQNIYGLKLIAGRFFSEQLTDSWQDAMVVNETTVKNLGFKNPKDAIGKKYVIGINRITPRIIGVVKDFNIESLKSNIKPVVLLKNHDFFREFSVRISDANVAGTIAGLNKEWKQFSPNYPFEYHFLE